LPLPPQMPPLVRGMMGGAGVRDENGLPTGGIPQVFPPNGADWGRCPWEGRICYLDRTVGLKAL